MTYDPNNPFSASQPSYGAPPPAYSQYGGDMKPGPTSLQLMRSYQFVFEHEQWMSNVLLATVCHVLIPVVGPLVCLGYMAEIIEALHRRQAPPPYPKFDFGRFGDYLKRGVWPFLAALVLSIVIVPVVMIVMGGGFGLMAAIGNNKGDGARLVAGLAMVAMIVVYFIVIIGMNLVLQPVMLVAELTQDFGSAFRFDWHRDFVSKMWKEMLLSMVFLVFSSMVLSVVGMLLCCIGVYPAVTLVLFAQAHLNYQMYEIYLSRGGMPLALKTPGM